MALSKVQNPSTSAFKDYSLKEYLDVLDTYLPKVKQEDLIQEWYQCSVRLAPGARFIEDGDWNDLCPNIRNLGPVFCHIHATCVCMCIASQTMEILDNKILPPCGHTLRHTEEQPTIHRGMDVVIIAEINTLSFVTVLSHVLRSLVREKRCLLAVKCVLKSQRLCLMMQLHFVGVLLWSIFFIHHSMLQYRYCCKWIRSQTKRKWIQGESFVRIHRTKLFRQHALNALEMSRN